jgi:hypothetical protein
MSLRALRVLTIFAGGRTGIRPAKCGQRRCFPQKIGGTEGGPLAAEGRSCSSEDSARKTLAGGLPVARKRCHGDRTGLRPPDSGGSVAQGLSQPLIRTVAVRDGAPRESGRSRCALGEIDAVPAMGNLLVHREPAVRRLNGEVEVLYLQAAVAGFRPASRAPCNGSQVVGRQAL